MEFKERYLNFEPIFINDHDELFPAMRNEIKLRTAPDITHVLTSRMDNDDSIHKDYISTVQSNFRAQPMALIDIIDGYNLVIEPVIKLGRIRAPFNPFSSLIEEASDLKTILSKYHKDWEKNSNIISIKGKRLWIQVIHEKNKVNTYRRGLLSSFDNLHADFGIPQDVIVSFPKPHPLRTAIENITTLVYLGLKDVKKSLSKLIKI